MTDKFERVEKHKHLYRRQYQIANGEWSTIFYARFTDWKGKRRLFPLGTALKTAVDKLKDLEARNVWKEDFDAVKKKGLTVSKWSEIFLELDEVKEKRSFDRDRQHMKHINRFFGSMLLTDIKRDHLFKYKNGRLGEHIIRNGKPANKNVSLGTVSNELSCFRRVLNVAKRESIEASIPSFEGLIVRSRRERVLEQEEEDTLLKHYPLWLRRLAIVARETCLSEGDLIRLTEAMIDKKGQVIVPEGGRLKTGARQVSPLKERVKQILEDIGRDKKSGAIVANVAGLVFTREDGRAITKDMIVKAVKKAARKGNIRDFRFHDYRHTVLTDWACKNINVDVAMLAAGHESVQMHKRYVNLKNKDVAVAFGLATQWQHGNEPVTNESVTS